MVTGFARAAVQVAVTFMPCLDESWTEGSLTVQFELTIIAVFAVHGPLPPNRLEATKTWLLAGAAAVWSTAAEGGATRKPTTLQSLEFPQLPMDSNAVQSRPPKKILQENIVDSSFRPAILLGVFRSNHPVTLRTLEVFVFAFDFHSVKRVPLSTFTAIRRGLYPAHGSVCRANFHSPRSR